MVACLWCSSEKSWLDEGGGRAGGFRGVDTVPLSLLVGMFTCTKYSGSVAAGV